jgi:hypothetical protein
MAGNRAIFDFGWAVGDHDHVTDAGPGLRPTLRFAQRSPGAQRRD